VSQRQGSPGPPGGPVSDTTKRD